MSTASVLINQLKSETNEANISPSRIANVLSSMISDIGISPGPTPGGTTPGITPGNDDDDIPTHFDYEMDENGDDCPYHIIVTVNKNSNGYNISFGTTGFDYGLNPGTSKLGFNSIIGGIGFDDDFDTTGIMDMRLIALTDTNIGTNYEYRKSCIRLGAGERVVIKANTSALTSMHDFFAEESGIKNLEIPTFSTPNVNDFSGMFRGCSSLETLDISGLQIKNGATLTDMFQDTTSLRQIKCSSAVKTTLIATATTTGLNVSKITSNNGWITSN